MTDRKNLEYTFETKPFSATKQKAELNHRYIDAKITIQPWSIDIADLEKC